MQGCREEEKTEETVRRSIHPGGGGESPEKTKRSSFNIEIKMCQTNQAYTVLCEIVWMCVLASMFAYMCVCVLCMCVCVFCACVCLCECVCVYVCVCVHTHVHACLCMRIV